MISWSQSLSVAISLFWRWLCWWRFCRSRSWMLFILVHYLRESKTFLDKKSHIIYNKVTFTSKYLLSNTRLCILSLIIRDHRIFPQLYFHFHLLNYKLLLFCILNFCSCKQLPVELNKCFIYFWKLQEIALDENNWKLKQVVWSVKLKKAFIFTNNFQTSLHANCSLCCLLK